MKKLLAMILLLSLAISFSVPAYAASSFDLETLVTEATAGNTQAMMELGMAYYEGTELKRNYSKALEWLGKAADAGMTGAYYPIGQIYEKGGDGIARDMTEAMEWYNRAADTGDENAKRKLGTSANVTSNTKGRSTSSSGLVYLDGEFGAPEIVRVGDNSGYENPFYLENPVTNCTHVQLVLSVQEKQGICTGNYYLYVKDLDGKWHHTAVFKLKQNHINGPEVTFELDLDTVETFVAVALWPADKGMDFTAIYNYAVYVDSRCVSEYSRSLPRPSYTPSTVNCAVISLHFVATAYKNPFAAFAAWVDDIVGPGPLGLGDIYDLYQDIEDQAGRN